MSNSERESQSEGARSRGHVNGRVPFLFRHLLSGAAAGAEGGSETEPRDSGPKASVAAVGLNSITKNMIHKLIIFVSSPAGLKDHRDEVEKVLTGLEIDGSRFETWPPVPVAATGMAECFRRINEADGVILILGEDYGTIIENGLSATVRAAKR
jgi:hypothetical protein